jgi:hypothetical protein
MADNAIVELSPGGYNTIIRMVHRADHDRVQWVVSATHEALCRLKAKRIPAAAVAKMPEGSDQADLGSFKAWLDKLIPADKAAIAQVQAIDATAFARS